ncbi:MAG: ATP-binding cassette domain-containing protein [Nannocystis sp.]|nr:ATP-binding cassette domain-containing protein [Nannocystis sp.]MBA3549224.1 ATP-binding cassette domain-containing protein [Nannocystis sp.]
MTERTDGSLLRARGLGVALGGREVVAGLDLELRPGAAVALVGPSGAGKSAVLRALVGLEPALRGSLRFAGVELVGAPDRAWSPLRRGVQLCWQDAGAALDPHLTVAQLLDEARVLMGLPRWRVGSNELGEVLRRVALDPSLALRLPGSLSGGQRQRVGLARALAAEPALLLADELTSALDRPVAWELVDLLRGLRRSGLGILLVTHDLSLLPGTVDEVIVLGGGEVVERGATAQVLGAPQHTITRALRAAVPRLPG